MANMLNDISQSRLKEMLHYDPDTGVFTWAMRKARCITVGDVAGSDRGTGYLQICIDKRTYLAHRLAWLYVHGVMPDHHIDHINGVRPDNRIANLREATVSENNQNRRIGRNNTSGHIGVVWSKSEGKWMASIKLDGVRRYLGYFTEITEAAAAYDEAKQELHTFCPVVRAAGGDKCVKL